MRILQVVHGFPPTRRAGTEIYAYNLSKELSKRHDVYVLYPVMHQSQKRYSLDKHDINGLHVIELASIPSGLRSWTTPMVSPKSIYRDSRTDSAFETILDETRPELVHFQHLIGLSASLIRLCNERAVPTVMTLHDFWLICHRNHLLKDNDAVCSGPDEECYSCLQCYSGGLITSAFSALPALSDNDWMKGIAKAIFNRIFMLFHGKDFFRQRDSYLKSLVDNVDAIITPSDFMRRRFIEYGLPDEKIRVSGHGMDTASFDGFVKTKSDRLRFGFVAPFLGNYKGVHVLIQAFNRVKDDRVELRIYGMYNPRSRYYKDLKRAATNPNIHFMNGFVDVRVPYSQMDVLIVPSLCYESYSLVTQEAFITKTPVIASNIGALPEFVEHNKNGLLFRPGDSDDLYEKIRALIENPGLIGEFQANIKPVKTIGEQAIELESIYEKLRSHSRASRNA